MRVRLEFEEQQAQEERMAQARNAQVIKEDEQPLEEEEDDRGNMHMDMDHQQDFNEKGGALVEEARRLMKDDQDADEAPAVQENAGPKIKMNRIGKKGKKAEPSAPGAAKPYSIENQAKAEKGKVWDKVAEKSLSAAGFSEQDIEFMKKAIQVLCQSTNPLGKSIDFVTDDIDSMNKEFEYWRKESNSCLVSLAEQQKITEEVIQPLQDQLAELEEKIRDQTAKVNSTKSQIIRNDLTVQNLLYSVITQQR